MAISTASFNERLQRIEAGQQRNKGRMVLHVGEAELKVRTLDDLRLPGRDKAAPRGSALVFAVALVLGGLAYAVSAALRARFFPMPAPEALLADLPWATGLGFGLVMAALLGPLFGLRGRSNWAGLALGVVLASACLHNLAFWAPAQAELAFTSDWVNLHQAATEPGSLMFRAQLFTL